MLAQYSILCHRQEQWFSGRKGGEVKTAGRSIGLIRRLLRPAPVIKPLSSHCSCRWGMPKGWIFQAEARQESIPVGGPNYSLRFIGNEEEGTRRLLRGLRFPGEFWTAVIVRQGLCFRGFDIFMGIALECWAF